MKKVFSKRQLFIDEIQHINCDDEMIENTVVNLLSEQYPSANKISIENINDDMVEVNIDI